MPLRSSKSPAGMHHSALSVCGCSDTKVENRKRPPQTVPMRPSADVRRWGHSLAFPFVLGLLPTADPGCPW